MTDRALTLGIGCRRGVTVRQIEQAVRVALGARPLDEVGQVTTIDSKAGEPALVEFCRHHALPLRTFTRDAIAAIAPEQFSGSQAARMHLGVHGVSEPCAVLGAGGGVLLAGRTVHEGVTVAIAVDPANAAATVAFTEGVQQ